MSEAVDSRVPTLAAIFERVFAWPKDRFEVGLDHDLVKRWDSIGHMALVADLEATFGVEFDIDTMVEMHSVEKILLALDALGCASK